MKKTKKFKKILLNKKRKNPKIDSAFFKHYLIEILVHGDPKTLSNLESYMAIGEYCNDCDRTYYNCACEGSREIPGFPCENCDQKRCICDLNIYDKNGNLNYDKIRKRAWVLAKKYLDDFDLDAVLNSSVTQYFRLRTPSPNYYSPFMLKLEKINKDLKFIDKQSTIHSIIRNIK